MLFALKSTVGTGPKFVFTSRLGPLSEKSVGPLEKKHPEGYHGLAIGNDRANVVSF